MLNVKKLLCKLTQKAAAIGSIVNKDTSTAVAVPTATWTSVASVTLGPGVWVLVGTVSFASNATGRRTSGLSNNGTALSGAYLRMTGVSAAAVSGGATNEHTSFVTGKLTAASTTYHLVGWQNSGGDLNTTGYLRAVRVSG